MVSDLYLKHFSGAAVQIEADRERLWAGRPIMERLKSSGKNLRGPDPSQTRREWREGDSEMCGLVTDGGIGGDR